MKDLDNQRSMYLEGLKDFLEQNDITRAAFARKTGIKPQTVVDIIGRNKDIYLEHVLKIITSYPETYSIFFSGEPHEVIKEVVENENEYKPKYQSALEELHEVYKENRKLSKIIMKILGEKEEK